MATVVEVLVVVAGSAWSFVNYNIIDQVELSLLQFHGAESAADCAGWSRPVIKAIRVPPDGSAAALAAAFPDVDYLLVDAWVPGRIGGTGVRVADEAIRASPLLQFLGRQFDEISGFVAQVRCRHGFQRVRQVQIGNLIGLRKG